MGRAGERCPAIPGLAWMGLLETEATAPPPAPRSGAEEEASHLRLTRKERHMLKVLAWTVGIIFLIGLLVVFGVIDLVF